MCWVLLFDVNYAVDRLRTMFVLHPYVPDRRQVHSPVHDHLRFPFLSMLQTVVLCLAKALARDTRKICKNDFARTSYQSHGILSGAGMLHLRELQVLGRSCVVEGDREVVGKLAYC